MSYEPPTSGSLVITYGFFFLIIVPASFACKGFVFRNQNFTLIDGGNCKLTVSPETFLTLTEDCTLDLDGSWGITEDIEGSVGITWDMKKGYMKNNGEESDICAKVDKMKEDGGIEQRFHDEIQCLLQFINFDKCPVKKQTLTHASCDLTKYKKEIAMAEGKSYLKLTITANGGTCIIISYTEIGKQKQGK